MTGFFYFSKIQYVCFCLLLAGCAASYQVLDVIDLSPPREVRAEREGDRVTIRWQPGVERRQKQFSGYKIFVAAKSLATTPALALPAPITLPDTVTTFSFASKDTARLFIHLRSCAGKRQISLPSLPEVIVPGRR
jgi:hypothetical protein